MVATEAVPLEDQIRTYRANPSTAGRNAIMTRLMPWMEKEAGIASRKHKSLDEGDALSVVSIAVMKSIDVWPSEHGGPAFKAYASGGIGRDITSAAIGASTHFSAKKFYYAREKGILMPRVRSVSCENDRGDNINVVDMAPDPRLRTTSLVDDVESFSGFLDQLSPAERQVMSLHYTENKSVSEIADEIGFDDGAVQQLLEAAHVTIRDRMLLSAGIAEGVDMTTFPDDLLEFAKLAIAEAPKRQTQPDRFLIDMLSRDTAFRVSLLNVVCKMMIEIAGKDLRTTSPSFAPAPQANRQPPRGLTAITATSVQVMQSMLDSWKMADGRRLGDVTGAELEEYIMAEVRRSARHAGRATFYQALQKRVPADKTVREAVPEKTVATLYQHACAKASIEFAPKAVQLPNATVTVLERPAIGHEPAAV